MPNEKFAKSLKDTFGPQYDSDEDLDDETQRKIKNSGSLEADKIRDEAWDKAGTYSKTMRVLKGAWSGDKRSK